MRAVLKAMATVALFVAGSTGGTANASTFQVSGLFSGFSGIVYSCTFPGCPGPPQPGMPPLATIDGTLAFANGVLTNINLTVFPGTTYTNPLLSSPFLTTGSYSVSPDEQNWSISIHTTSSGLGSFFVNILDLTLTNSAGLLTASLHEVAQPGRIGFDAYVGDYTGFTGTVGIVPIPAALPLFATGLAALGLLGWRRKRKAAAIAP